MEKVDEEMALQLQSYSTTSLASYHLKYVVLTERIQPYVKAGFGVMAGRPNHSFLFMGRFDAGVTFFLTEQIGLRAGYGIGLAKHNNNLLLGNVGIVYYFE